MSDGVVVFREGENPASLLGAELRLTLDEGHGGVVAEEVEVLVSKVMPPNM